MAVLHLFASISGNYLERKRDLVRLCSNVTISCLSMVERNSCIAEITACRRAR